MTTIHKYQFSIADYVSILMPYGAIILHVDVQAGRPCMWAMVDPDAVLVHHEFRVFGTGHVIGAGEVREHVATFQDGRFVWHVFACATAAPAEGQR